MGSVPWHAASSVSIVTGKVTQQQFGFAPRGSDTSPPGLVQYLSLNIVVHSQWSISGYASSPRLQNASNFLPVASTRMSEVFYLSGRVTRGLHVFLLQIL